jgi:uncharacterized protein (UPF0210 family)
MKIRAITIFVSPSRAARDLAPAARLGEEARRAFSAAGFTVQTVRLATSPFFAWADGDPVAAAARLEAEAAAAGFDYLSLGAANPSDLGQYALIAPILAATQNVFLTGHLTDARGVSLPACRASAAVIRDAAAISPDGFGNLRFAALANVPAYTPFFPAAHAAPAAPGVPALAFALAMEAADLAVTAFEQAASLTDARAALIASIETAAAALVPVAESLAAAHAADFRGLDFTPAPFPEEAVSLGAALERLGVPRVGQPGSLAAAAFLADTLDRARLPKVGFNGLMLPVLEDAILARRAAEGTLTLKDLLLYSAVCGAGLDTVPLPGDASVAALSAVLLDLAALALRLNKPLTARLMPIPGKRAGDETDFDFAFFANSRVLALDAAPLFGLLAGDDPLELRPRPLR